MKMKLLFLTLIVVITSLSFTTKHKHVYKTKLIKQSNGRYKALEELA